MTPMLADPDEYDDFDDADSDPDADRPFSLFSAPTDDPDFHPDDPTPDEIARRAGVIRDGWDEEEERSRRYGGRVNIKVVGRGEVAQ